MIATGRFSLVSSRAIDHAHAALAERTVDAVLTDHRARRKHRRVAVGGFVARDLRVVLPREQRFDALPQVAIVLRLRRDE